MRSMSVKEVQGNLAQSAGPRGIENANAPASVTEPALAADAKPTMQSAFLESARSRMTKFIPKGTFVNRK
jgi:hypothetical protein